MVHRRLSAHMTRIASILRSVHPLGLRTMRQVVLLTLGLTICALTGSARPVTAAAASRPVLLFGLGPEADGALASPFTQSAPVHLLTSWYNGPDDLAWMTGWHTSLVPNAYAAGYALHLIVYDGEPEVNFLTAYGPACGRPYPMSARFVDDMQILAKTFAGTGRLYVTLFTEFQTYPCLDNQWVGAETYYKALQNQYLVALQVFHQYAPNSRVSLGWGGWQSRWDDALNGGGRSLFPYFASLMHASDFQSFQAMQSDSNVTDVLDMTHILGQYGPVMLAHYKPDNASEAVFDSDVRSILTDSYLSDVTAAGLFAFSFMDDRLILAQQTTDTFVTRAVKRFGQ
jgi:hypothetical protein